jgi:hypothetical protein
VKCERQRRRGVIQVFRREDHRPSPQRPDHYTINIDVHTGRECHDKEPDRSWNEERCSSEPIPPRSGAVEGDQDHCGREEADGDRQCDPPGKAVRAMRQDVLR